MNKYWFYKVGLVVVFLCFALLGEAKVKLPTLVSDGMVLQRGEPVNIWGTADPDETVSITFQKKSGRKNYKHSFSCREWLSTK